MRLERVFELQAQYRVFALQLFDLALKIDNLEPVRIQLDLGRIQFVVEHEIERAPIFNLVDIRLQIGAG